MTSPPDNALSSLNVLSLFSGIGGLELGLERAGMTVVGQVELDEFCRSVLAKHWPEVPKHDDVRTAVDWWRGEQRPAVDVVAGGYPCQGASGAGLKRGVADPRWLWPAMADVIDDLHPEWVVWENVPGLLTRGLDVVHGDLVRLGYRHRVGWTSACAVGTPHMRKRLFGVAHAAGDGRAARRGPEQGPALLEPVRRGAQPGGSWAAESRPVGVAYGVPAGMDRRRALGNAVVPQVAEHIGRLIVAAATEASAA